MPLESDDEDDGDGGDVRDVMSKATVAVTRMVTTMVTMVMMVTCQGAGALDSYSADLDRREAAVSAGDQGNCFATRCVEE